MKLPKGFRAYVANFGVKDGTDDFVVLAADVRSPAAAVFTKSLFAGCSVDISRQHIADPHLRAMVVISKNSNVATGEQGRANALEVVNSVANRLQCRAEDIAIASTGVIGRQYPMDRIRAGLAGIPAELPLDTVDEAAAGIMTTDTHPKMAEAAIGNSGARVVGIAKGVGMIEPDMATLITVFMTDAALSAKSLNEIFRRVIARTFNAVSVDTDTSTSDTAVIIASGGAGKVRTAQFEAALEAVALELTKMVARDGEGATKLLEVTVRGANDDRQAKVVAKSIVNSPLVKTAVHGADPNWGRVAMAIGKCWNETGIDKERVVIRFGEQEVYPTQLDSAQLDELSAYMRGDTVGIDVDLQIGAGHFTVYGCDLSDGYVRINADYTT